MRQVKPDSTGAEDGRKGKISFDEAVARYYNRVFRVALHVTGSRDDAQDVCQEVFLYLLSHLCDFRGESALFTWIFRITRSAALRCIGKKKPGLFQDDMPEPAAPAAEGTGAEHSEKRAAVLRAFAALPENYRIVASMHLVEGVPLRDIAGIFEMPEGTIRWWMFKARELLRERLAEWLA
jgi:RNA polymerase sigma-70 factor (ECF subfamily)